MFRKLLSWLSGGISGGQISSPPKSKWENISIEYKNGQEAIEAIAAFVNDKSDYRSMIQEDDVFFCPYSGRASFLKCDDNQTALKARNSYATQLTEKGLQVECFKDSYVIGGTKNTLYILTFRHPDLLEIKKESGFDAIQQERYKRDVEAYKKRLAEEDGNVRGRYICDKAAIDALRGLVGEEMVLPGVSISARICKGEERGASTPTLTTTMMQGE